MEGADDAAAEPPWIVATRTCCVVPAIDVSTCRVVQLPLDSTLEAATAPNPLVHGFTFDASVAYANEPSLKSWSRWRPPPAPYHPLTLSWNPVMVVPSGKRKS